MIFTEGFEHLEDSFFHANAGLHALTTTFFIRHVAFPLPATNVPNYQNNFHWPTLGAEDKG